MTGADDRVFGAAAIAELVTQRAVTAQSIVSAAIERCRAVQSTINAFTLICEDPALAAAHDVARRLDAGQKLPLAGVPIAIKDTTPVAGQLTTSGSLARRTHRSSSDAPVVARLREAGAIIVARTTTSEFATSSFTETPLYGITRNPWDLERTCGGSSGGSAAAVAARCIPLAEGSDAGGSVRIPAALCGCVGLKPSFGRIPFVNLPSTFEWLWHHGPLAQTVDDAALFLEVTSGYHDADPWSALPLFERGESFGRGIAGKRIALSLDLGFFEVADDVQDAVREAARRLREAGAVVEEVDIPWSAGILDAFLTEFAALVACVHGVDADELGERATPVLRELVERGRRVTGVDIKRANIERTRQWQALAAVFRRYDGLMCPTMCMTAPRVGATDFDFVEVDERGRLRGLDMTLPFNNVSACPALTVPCGRGTDGMPVGVQFIGPPNADAQVLAIGHAFEISFAPGIGAPGRRFQ